MLITTYNNTTFARKTTITHYKSAIFTSRMYDVGSFSLVLKNTDAEIGDIIMIEDFSGIIMRIEKNVIGTTISGYDLKALLYQRVFEADKTYTGTPDSIIKQVATDYLRTGDRTIQGLTVAGVRTGGTSNSYTFSKGEKVSKGLKTFCEKYSIGYKITFNESAMVFDTIPETATEKVYGRERHNVNDVEYVQDKYDYANVIYYEDDNQTVQTDGSGTGINRFEGFASSDIEEYKQSHILSETMRATPNNSDNISLGDVVTVIFDGVETTKTITEIETAIEHTKKVVTPVFGTEKENPIKKILSGA